MLPFVPKKCRFSLVAGADKQNHVSLLKIANHITHTHTHYNLECLQNFPLVQLGPELDTVKYKRCSHLHTDPAQVEQRI